MNKNSDDDDEVFGDFEDLETGEVHAADPEAEETNAEESTQEEKSVEKSRCVHQIVDDVFLDKMLHVIVRN